MPICPVPCCHRTFILAEFFANAGLGFRQNLLTAFLFLLLCVSLIVNVYIIIESNSQITGLI